MTHLNNSLITYFERTIFFLLLTLPIQLVSTSLILNTGIIISGVCILIILLANKKLFNTYSKIIYAFLILWMSLIINSFFSTNFVSSIDRAISFLRFPFFVIAILYIFSFENYRKNIYFYWTIFFFIVSFVAAASFFAKYFLPLLSGTRQTVESLDNEVMELDEAAF